MTSTDQSTKKGLFALCQTYVQQRIDTARQAMETAQESANSETKSSAGDKYETGRAMAQLERDRNAQLLAEALKLSQDLDRLTIDKTYETVQPGCLVITSRGAFFVSVSAGKLMLDGKDYFAISPASPIATALMGRRRSDSVQFNKLAYQLIEIV